MNEDYKTLKASVLSEIKRLRADGYQVTVTKSNDDGKPVLTLTAVKRFPEADWKKAE